MERQIFIKKELESIKSKISTLHDAKLITCVPAQVRIEISRTKTKTLTICMQFPSDYPNRMILIELKSRTLPQKFLEVAQKAAENNNYQILRNGQQVLAVINFIGDYLDNNPLCVCAEEVSDLRKAVNADENNGEFFKIKQKQSAINFRIVDDAYFLNIKLAIDNDYPFKPVITTVECNLPKLFHRYLTAQATEIARKCVEKPLLRKNNNAKTVIDFKPSPSMKPVGLFLLEMGRRYPSEMCSLCQTRCLPIFLTSVIEDEESDEFVERVYCGHIFHHKCLDDYMKTPPFNEAGKKCPSCQSVIYHGKWKSSEKTREERWAHEQAKHRELEQVVDFLA